MIIRTSPTCRLPLGVRSGTAASLPAASLPAASLPANVHILGETANAAGKHVTLLSYDDMLTLNEHTLDTAVVDSTGRFALQCYITYPRLVVLQIETYTQSFYIEPGRTYHVWLPTFRWEQDEERNVYLDPVALPLEFLDLPPDELNLQMLRLHQVVDSLVDTMRLHLDFKYRRQRRYFDTLAATVQALVPDGDNIFFNRYKQYLLAQMRFDMGFASRRQMLQNVLPQPILYHDECYMRTLFDILTGMVSQGMRKVPKHRLVEWVHTLDLDRYIDSLGTEPLLYDEQLRELAAIVALRESLFDPDYDPAAVSAMLLRLADASKWPEHRSLALAARSGAAASPLAVRSGTADFLAADSLPSHPFFSLDLPDADHRPVHLDSLRGKWLYIAFVRVNDPNCIREIETMAHFQCVVDSGLEVGGRRSEVEVGGRKSEVEGLRPPTSDLQPPRNVEFITISCDREFQKMYHLLRNSRRGARYSWTWLHFDGNYRWLESLGVVSYPSFLLIDPQGRQPYSVTPDPASGFLLHAPWQTR